MNKNPKIFMALAAFALVGGAVGSYYQWSSLQEVRAKVGDIRAQMREPEKVTREVEQSAAEVADFTAKLNHLEKGVPQMAYVPTLLAELDKIGTENGIDVLGVRPVVQAAPLTANQADGGAPKRKPYEELNIEVKGRGDYRSVLSFVQALQRFPKIVAARTVSITPKMGQDKEMRLDITIELRAYLFPTSQGPTTMPQDRATDRPIKISGRNREIS